MSTSTEKRNSRSSILIVAGVVVGIAAFIVANAVFVVDQAEQAIVLEFGKPVGKAITKPGLHFKRPFIQEVRRFDKRLLPWDGDPNQIPTSGREFISVDTTARWRIVDPLKFLQSVTNESGAQSRLDDIIDSVVRDQISSTKLTDIVRSSDWQVTEADLRRLDTASADPEDAELTAAVKVGRYELTRRILTGAQSQVGQYGIELIDVRIKRLNYISDVRTQVFDRMISERQRIAEKFRSEGIGEAARIEGETSRELAEVRSEAKRQAEVVRGQADAEATRIYAKAFAEDAEFYGYFRTLESYRKTLGQSTTLLLSSEADYFRYLQTFSPAVPDED